MPGLIDAAREALSTWIAPKRPVMQPDDSLGLMDLPLRRETATALAEARAAAASRESLTLPFGLGSIDNDEHLYRRLTGNGSQALRRDLAPLAQDRMLEIANFLWEQNCFANRLITLMTDLILGEGISVQAADARNQEVIDRLWNHRVNALAGNVRRFYNALSVNGELLLPVSPNPISGIPTLGYLDPYQIKQVITLPDNVLVPDVVVLKPSGGNGDGQRLRVVREDPSTGLLDGEVFFFTVNVLPNSVRGRSDLLRVADWLDLYDQYMFAEVERVNLLSSFVWDYKIEGATSDQQIQDKLKKFPKPTPNQVFAHNEKETLEAVTPDLKANDRSEVAHMMRVHIAGSMGYPLSYLGDTDSNRATIEGQNDVMLKTPAARQKEFSSFIDLVVRYTLEQAQRRNRALFRDVQQGYQIVMPEISAKDVSRVGTVMASVAASMDTALNNRTMSRKAAVQIQVAVIKHLGVNLDAAEVMEDADDDAAQAQLEGDQRAADIAAGRGTRNPPVPDDPTDLPLSEDQEDPEDQVAKEAIKRIEAQIADLMIRPNHVINVDVPKQEAPRVDVQVAAPNVTVEAAPAPQVNVTVPPAQAPGPAGPVRRVIARDKGGRIESVTDYPAEPGQTTTPNTEG